MGKKTKFTIKFTLIAINIFMIIAMNFCAYTSYLNAHVHPNASYFGMAFPIMLVLNLVFIPLWLILKPKNIYIPVTGMLMCAWAIRAYCPINPFTEEDPSAFKFISYNVMHLGNVTPPDKMHENPIILYLLDQDADVVCMQEAMRLHRKTNLDTIKTIYPYIDVHHSPYNTMAIFSKHQILEVTDLSNDSIRSRAFAYKIKAGEDTILIINNHFESFKLQDEDKADYKEIITNPEDSDTEERVDQLLGKITDANSQRALQADWLYEYVKNCDSKKIIVCGDFNDNPISYTHNKITKLLNDAYTRGGNGPGWSYNRSGMYFRIDNILVSDNIGIKKATVDNSINISDHYPIISWLEIGK